MSQPDDHDQQIADLQGRLTRLSEASLRINESLDLDVVLRSVLESAHALTDARYALVTTFGDDAQVEDYLVSGLNEEETEELWALANGQRFFEYLRAIPGSLRVVDFAAHLAALGLPEFLPSVPVSALLSVPIRHQGVNIGIVYVAKSEPGEAFSREDEEALVMFASHIALVVANARRHRNEQRARNDLETLLDTTPVGVVVFDLKSGAATSFNHEVRRISDLLRDPHEAPEQSVGERLSSLTVRRADGREFSLREFPLTEALSNPETVRAEEITMHAPNGRSVKVMVNATPISSTSHQLDDSSEGEMESMIVTLQDLTPIEEMERLRSEFLGMVSHELRTPLSAIRGSATSVLDASAELDPGETRQFLRIIVDQADNMRAMIGDLLDMARIETGSLSISAEAAEVPTLVERARSTFANANGRRAIKIDLAPDLPLVMADRRRIAQVIGNLLANAAAHSSTSETITIRAVSLGSQVEISVADAGRGIPAEQLPYLFRKFAPADASESQDEPARESNLSPRVGLGLAICQGIVDAHGGRIWAESDGPGLGARFSFTIPVVVERPRRGVAVQQRATHAAEFDGRRILVIDDDPQTLQDIRHVLVNAGYEAVVTGDPADVLTLLSEQRPDLVVLDMMLPGVDGIDLMRDISSVTDVPVIFISVYGQDEVIARAFDSGAADYLVKPLSPTELTARIRAALRRSEEPRMSTPAEPFVEGDLTVDYSLRAATLAGRALHLTATEYSLLSELAFNAGRVVTHDQLLRRVWGGKKPGDRQSLRTHIRRLRQKLGDGASNPRYIVSQSRVGYRMVKSGDSPSPIIPQ